MREEATLPALSSSGRAAASDTPAKSISTPHAPLPVLKTGSGAAPRFRPKVSAELYSMSSVVAGSQVRRRHGCAHFATAALISPRPSQRLETHTSAAASVGVFAGRYHPLPDARARDHSAATGVAKRRAHRDGTAEPPRVVANCADRAWMSEGCRSVGALPLQTSEQPKWLSAALVSCRRKSCIRTCR
jgi:hypothetical protein